MKKVLIIILFLNYLYSEVYFLPESYSVLFQHLHKKLIKAHHLRIVTNQLGSYKLLSEFKKFLNHGKLELIITGTQNNTIGKLIIFENFTCKKFTTIYYTKFHTNFIIFDNDEVLVFSSSIGSLGNNISTAVSLKNKKNIQKFIEIFKTLNLRSDEIKKHYNITNKCF